MFDSSRRQPPKSLQPPQSPISGIAGTEAAPTLMRQPGDESVEGWVTAEITPYPRPLRRLSFINADDRANGFTVSGELLEDFFAAQYAPPAAQFVLAVVELEREPAKPGRLRWADVEIVLRSPQEWPVQLGAGGAPLETPDLLQLVEELAAEAMSRGWEPAGRGRTWCSLRFRRRG